MNKKGFTLIELLAVIVILAIIAMIAAPIILGIIRDSRESANLRTVERYGKAIETAVSSFMTMRPDVTEPLIEVGATATDLDCHIDATTAAKNSGNSACGDGSRPVVYSGTVVECASVTYNPGTGEVTVLGCAVGEGSSDRFDFSSSANACKREDAGTSCLAP